jgi:hypothetical protein
MQRSISDKKPLVRYFFYLGFYILYSSLGTIYPLLPPLLAVLFALYAQAMQKENFTELLFVMAALLIFEANYGFLLFSSIIYFYVQYKLILPKIKQNISCEVCVKILSVTLSYLGYFFFLSLLANIFLLEAPSFSYYIVYYIVIEFFLVSLL